MQIYFRRQHNSEEKKVNFLIAQHQIKNVFINNSCDMKHEQLTRSGLYKNSEI
jgi:hypothetical protein